MNRLMLVIISIALIAIAVLLYRRYYAQEFDVDPHAAEEIRRAQHR